MRKLWSATLLLLSILALSTGPLKSQGCPEIAGGCPPPQGNCLTYQDLTAYFVPTYSGWQTARLTEQGEPPSQPIVTYDRKYLYGTNKLALVKFNDPHSVETYTWDNFWIYLTAENGINGTSQSRFYPANNSILGLIWMPRYAFTPCYNEQVYYNNCNTCPCQYASTDPAHCSVHPSLVSLTTYNFGGTIGTIPTLIKQDTYDDNTGGERYYYGLGYGFLRYEAVNAQGQLTAAGQEVGETPNDPLADQACFHP